jgi:dTDP-4-dehydrorhamnose reductase
MDKRNVVILGGGGRLGAALTRAYKDSFNVTSLGRSEADLQKPETVAEIIRRSEAHLVINCAAMTNVDLCEAERDLALQVNAKAPQAIAQAASASGARLIHISTDYVFSGQVDRPYQENDMATPVSWYGETKKRGELLVLEDACCHAVVRVAWVFGPDRDSFLDKALQTAARGGQVSAVSDKYSSPTYTKDVAKALAVFFEDDVPGGVYHVCNAGICSWQEWAQYAIESAIRQGATIKPQNVVHLKLIDIKAMVAQRPVYSAMTCRKIEKLLGHDLRGWTEAVDEYVALLMAQGRIL